MKNNSYEMTTVYNYIKLLDNGLEEKEQKIKAAVEKHMLQMRRANTNAKVLEQLLA